MSQPVLPAPWLILSEQSAGSPTEHPDQIIARLAARQHDRVNRRQLLAAGLTRHQVQRRLDTARLHQVHAGVYAVGHRFSGPWGVYAAAALAYTPQAAIGGLSGAAMWGVRPCHRSVVDVVVSKEGGDERPGIRLHRSRLLTPADVVHLEGIPVTSVPRTYVDIVAQLPRDALARAWREGLHSRLLDVGAIEAELRHARAGTAAIRALLRDREVVPVLRSELEERAWRLVRQARLPIPEANAWLPDLAGGIEVDLFWRAQRLIVELDGWRVHGTYAAFQADRSRDALVQLAGLRIVRLTWRDVTRDRHATARLLCAFLRP